MHEFYQKIIEFHGHSCPGLAIGYRMANAAMEFFKSDRSEDEELVAIVENDACGVDALQYISGCTFGKGNLIFKDYGKHVYTLFSRKSEKALRVVFHDDRVPEEMREDRARFIDWLLTVPQEKIISIKHVDIKPPEKARIFQPIKCDFCGEFAMRTRIREIGGKNACIPCVEQRIRK